MNLNLSLKKKKKKASRKDVWPTSDMGGGGGDASMGVFFIENPYKKV